MCSKLNHGEYRKLYAAFQKKARQDKEQSTIENYLTFKCKQIEDNNKMVKQETYLKK